MADERLIDELERLVALTEAACHRVAEVEELRRAGSKRQLLGRDSQDALSRLLPRLRRLQQAVTALGAEAAGEEATRDLYSAPWSEVRRGHTPAPVPWR